VRETIAPALEQGTVVISDRFFDSTTVYQGVARELSSEIVQTLNAFATGNARPDVTFILDVDVETARQRMLRRVRPVNVKDRMEQEPIEFYERVCQGYHALAKAEPDRFILLDGGQSPEAIEEQIWNLVQSKIENRKSEM
jgi:dTMP kinase